MAEEVVQEIGPIDYVVVEWSGSKQPNGEALPHLIDLVERGIIRIIDFAFIMKSEDGTVAQLALDELGAEFAILDGASADLIGDSDVAEASSVLEPGSAAALLVYENAWAAQFAAALRGNGAQVVATGRIPYDEFVAALDEVEA
ncbi:DUF6325 family protein [Gordonia sp. OPL2]|uniref:DUF6325 family protein n=1 Tax=Gordonia sp. OPL2 TaxID=2486274 RepID=UPI001655F103|nr:DUF6325 family protein [Gordonia sp. OPL2]ROZ88843.1 DUF1269 domain-containing protein [Gordonia sp. OPL2]